jgi:hypothetical protein
LQLLNLIWILFKKSRKEELDEGRAIQSGMLPSQPLRAGGHVCGAGNRIATILHYSGS